jgi:hypothetical protein
MVGQLAEVVADEDRVGELVEHVGPGLLDRVDELVEPDGRVEPERIGHAVNSRLTT